MGDIRNLNNVFNELIQEFKLDRIEIQRIFEEEAEKYLGSVFGYDVSVVLEKGGFYVYKDREIVFEDFSVLKKDFLKGLIVRVRKELRRRSEEEFIWRYYRFFRRRIKELVKGKIIGKKGRDFYVEFEYENGVLKERFIGIVNLADLTHSDRERIRRKERMEFWFGIKNVLVEDQWGVMRLKVILTRQSLFFIEKLFRLFGYGGKILRIKRVPYKVKVWVEERVEKEVIKAVAREIKENVKVSFKRG